MIKKPKLPQRDPETGEWRYRNKWYNSYPNEELEKDESEYDLACDMEINRRRDEGL